jgi:hemoglobin-like flavoprotein
MNMDPNSEEVQKSKRFATHAGHFIEMIDTALNMLGPDGETLREIMMELGTKHVRYGVTAEMFLVMGRILIEMMQEFLAEHRSEFVFSPAIKTSWTETYTYLSQTMLESYKKK